MKKISTAVMMIALSAGLGIPAAQADKADDTLRIAWGATGPIDNLDVYFNTNRTGLWLAQHVWDTLIFNNLAEGTYEPLLATSWEQVDDLTFEFTLREGVVFHNGEPFDGEDVAYTLNFVSNPDNGVLTQGNVNWIENVEVLEPYKVRLNLSRPFPQALEYLSGPLVIYPNEYYASVGPEGMNRMPIGTGPYEVVDIAHAERYRLSRNENYGWGSPKGIPAIANLDIREIADVQTQMAELLGGGIDFTADISVDQLEQITRVPGLATAQAETMRISYLGFDTAGRSGVEAFQNPLVRQAIAHAIDRQSLVDALIRGDSRVIHTPCFPSQFGCDEAAAVQWDYDPERARELLVEAGYGDGLSIELYNYRSPSWAEAIAGDLSRIGIHTSINQMGFFGLRDLLHEGRTALFLMDWGSLSINDMSAITSRFFNHGPDDYNMDAELKEWLEIADSSSDPTERQEYYRMAIERITSELYWLPMFSHVRNYAFTEDLQFIGYSDEIPRFYAYSWTE